MLLLLGGKVLDDGSISSGQSKKSRSSILKQPKKIMSKEVSRYVRFAILQYS